MNPPSTLRSLASPLLAILAVLTLSPASALDPPAGSSTPLTDPETASAGDRDRSAPDNPDSTSSTDEDSTDPTSRRALRPIVVTATRGETEEFYTPFVVESLSGSTLTTKKAYRTLPDALREIPGISPQKTGHGQGSPFIRGFTSQRTLLLIDGIRLNNAVFREGPNQYWNTIDLFTVDRLEVVKGPGSVLYGSDAIGGTVNVITRSRQPLPSGTTDPGAIGGRLHYRHATAEDSHIGRVEASGAISDWLGLLGGVTSKDFGTLSGGRHIGEQPNTSYHGLDSDLKAVVRLLPGLDLVLAHQSVHVDGAPRTHSTIFARSYRGTSVGSDLVRDFRQQRSLTYGQLHWDADLDWLTRVTFSLSLHRQKEHERRIRSNLRERRQGFQDDTYGAWIQLESPSPIGTLTYGVEHYHDEVDSFFSEFNPDGSLRTLRPRGPIADDASYDLFGVYVQDRFRPHETLEVILGGRFTHARARADQVDPDPTSGPDYGRLDDDFSSAVGSLRLLYEVAEPVNLFGGVSQGFRAPNLADLTRFDAARSGEVETPSPGLDPEEFIAFEIGTKIDIEECGLQGYLAYYHTLIDGMIVRFPTGNTVDGGTEVIKDNLGDGFVHGVELGLSWNFYQGLTAFGNFSWLEGEADNFEMGTRDREVFSKMQPATSLLGLRWDSEDRKYWVEVTALIAAEQDRLSTRDRADTQRIPPGGTPGYTVYGLKAGAEVYPGLQLFGGVENITDRDYRVHGSGQNEAGTNVVLGVDWQFDRKIESW